LGVRCGRVACSPYDGIQERQICLGLQVCRGFRNFNSSKWNKKRTLINAPDDPRSKENGLHVRKGAALVMLAKKDAQDEEEKFWTIPASRAWGNGVGRIGGLVGTVGTS